MRLNLRNLLDEVEEITEKDYADDEILEALDSLLMAYYKLEDDMDRTERTMAEMQSELDYRREASDELLRIKGFIR